MRRLINRILSNPLVYRLHAAGVDRYKRAAIRRIRNDFSGLKVLDLGCGTGNSTPLFSGADYTGIDLSEVYIKLARKKFPAHTFLAGDAGTIDWGEGYDVILINSLLHHLPDNKVFQIADKAARALTDTGIVILQEPLRPRDNEWYHCLMMRLDRGNYFRTLGAWKDLLREGGLIPTRIERYDLRFLGIYGFHYLSICLKIS